MWSRWVAGSTSDGIAVTDIGESQGWVGGGVGVFREGKRWGGGQGSKREVNSLQSELQESVVAVGKSKGFLVLPWTPCITVDELCDFEQVT